MFSQEGVPITGYSLFSFWKEVCFMDRRKHLYIYNGPVMEFGTCIAHRWRASTYATTEKKARNNMAYQFKKQNNRNPDTMISLPGHIELVN